MQSADLPLGSPITPNLDQFQALAAAPDEGAVVMLNLLKFKEGGADTYLRYGDAAIGMVEERGGRVLWSGRAEQVLIGDPAADWDVVVLVEYPSRAAFVEMVSSLSTSRPTPTARRGSSAPWCWPAARPRRKGLPSPKHELGAAAQRAWVGLGAAGLSNARGLW